MKNMKNGNFILAWSNEDGMHIERYAEQAMATRRLRFLFDEQASDELTDNYLQEYLEDPSSEDDPYRLEKENLLRLKQKLELDEDEMILLEDIAYLQKNRFGERFDAMIVPAVPA